MATDLRAGPILLDSGPRIPWRRASYWHDSTRSGELRRRATLIGPPTIVSTDTLTRSGSAPSTTPSYGSGSQRQSAVASATSRPAVPPIEFLDTHPEDVFGENVFGKAQMKKRLPKSVFKSLIQTIEAGEKLDPTVADIVAARP